MIDKVKEILGRQLAHYGVSNRIVSIVAYEVCQLFPKSPDNPEGEELAIIDKAMAETGKIDLGSFAKYVDESGLLTDYKLYFRGFNLHISDIYKKHIFDDIVKDQRDLTASIENASFLQWLEHHGNKGQVELFKEGIK